MQALSGFTGRKEKRRRLNKSLVKSSSLTGKLPWKLFGLRKSEEEGIPGGAVKCVDIRRNTDGEGTLLGLF
jgi:hypothetical protein